MYSVSSLANLWSLHRNPVRNKNDLVIRNSDSDLLFNKCYLIPARMSSAVNNQDVHIHTKRQCISVLDVCNNSHLSQMADCSVSESYLPNDVGRR